jgi:hypothetical protein
MRIVLATVTFAMLAGTAVAQQAPLPRYGEEEKAKSPAEIAAEKASGEAYRKSLGNIPDQRPSDPWGAVRSDSAPKATVAAKPKKGRSAGTDVKP